MPPDPGEPHWPRQEDYESFVDFQRAIEDHVRRLGDPVAERADELIAETETYLTEQQT